jgi:hypothetical protein
MKRPEFEAAMAVDMRAARLAVVQATQELVAWDTTDDELQALVVATVAELPLAVMLGLVADNVDTIVRQLRDGPDM